ncbi:TPA: tyrosine-type recombinase/integrase [Bacillus anthracis]|nr:tyrosine-type recombinase/integrase [Bacillus anthracis]
MNTVEPIRDKKKIDAIKKYLIGSGKIRDYALFTVGINTGLRVSDLLKLTWDDILDEKRQFKNSIYIREDKTGKEKRFPINENAQNALERLLIGQVDLLPKQPIFVSRNGNMKPISRFTAWDTIKRACEAVGVIENVGTHTLRKTWGYWAWKNGVPLPIIMEVLNHSSITATKRYLGITQDEINEAYMGLNL